MSIILTKSLEYSSDRVADWFIHNECEFKRINSDHINFDIPSILLCEDFQYSSIWVRKLATTKILESGRLLNSYLSKEIRAFWREYLEFNSEYLLGSPQSDEPSNFSMLKIAHKCELFVPDSIVTTYKTDLIKFIESHEKVITKPLYAPLNIIDGDCDISFRTSFINNEDLIELNNTFHPTFFHQAIKRDYEVRLFYLKGKCWAMAFVVKKENEISPDIWNINKRREVPFHIPQEIQERVREFMDLAGYNTGSLDFVIKDGEWYFLELNPNGQYDFVSKACYYFLDREIAKILIDESRKRA